MGVFDVSFLNPSLRPKGGSGYGVLVDQIDIEQNRLESDGKLAPSDYDALIKKAQALYAHPGLTKAQRSNVAVKISQYERDKKTTALKDTGDIDRVNREIKDDMAKNMMLFANNPTLLLQANGDAIRLKLDRLSEVIDSMQQSGDDVSQHVNEFSATLADYNDLLQAQDDIKEDRGGGSPKSNFVAYVTTNEQGEINDINIGRTGSRSGYVETNGIYGGLQIYGKVNRKEFGKNVFQLGPHIFSAADYSIPDPQNPGAMRYNPLISEDQQRSFGQEGKGPSFAQIGQYKDVDLTQIRPQGAIRSGGWAEGEKGFLYKRLENGKYVKYVGATREQLGIKDQQIIHLPRVFEQSVANNTIETIDASAIPTLPFSVTPAPVSGPVQGPQRVTPEAAPSSTATPSPVSRTSAPVERTPIDVAGYAKQTFEKAKGILGRVFTGTY